MMEKLLTNQEFNDLVKEIKLETYDLRKDLVLETQKSVEDVLAKLKPYWKVIKSLLKIVKIVTPRKIDKAIDEFIAIVDKLLEETSGTVPSDLLEKFAAIWGTIKPILVNIKGITGQKVDAIIDEVIKIGDRLAQSDV
jgi:hypothetical protein